MYVQDNTLLLTDVFENFRNMVSKNLISINAPGLAKITALERPKVKLDVLTDVDVINGRNRN